MKIKALTLYQPYATLIAIGAKRFETRSWADPYRGPLAIHAGKTLDVNWGDRAFMHWLSVVDIDDPRKLPMGAVICICELTNIWHTEQVVGHISEQEMAFGNFLPKRAAWELKVTEVFEKPIPARGSQKLWDWERPA